MRGLISFSLFGNNLKYYLGILDNIALANEHYPNCDIIIYFEDTSYFNLVELESFDHIRIEKMGQSKHMSGMFWRFHSIEHSLYDFFLFRDADSRITLRESSMVNEWLNSGKNLHIIRDHPMHNAPILGGMWGIRKDLQNKLQHALLSYNPRGYYGEDQEFIWKHVYKMNRKNRFIHDPYFFRELPWSKSYSFGSSEEYVGEGFDQFQQYSTNLRESVRVWKNSPKTRLKLKLASIAMKIMGK
jgi:hypothetical protein